MEHNKNAQPVSPYEQYFLQRMTYSEQGETSEQSNAAQQEAETDPVKGLIYTICYAISHPEIYYCLGEKEQKLISKLPPSLRKLAIYFAKQPRIKAKL